LLVQALLELHLLEWPPTDSTSAETIVTMRRERSDASDAERRDATGKTVKDAVRAAGSQKDMRRATDLETTAVKSSPNTAQTRDASAVVARSASSRPHPVN
jgi:hypothetical protein